MTIQLGSFNSHYEATRHLVANGYIETNAGWLRCKAGERWNASIIIDQAPAGENSHGERKKYHRVVAERCDQFGKVLSR